jgi:PAS domain S-box-containing protein
MLNPDLAPPGMEEPATAAPDQNSPALRSDGGWEPPRPADFSKEAHPSPHSGSVFGYDSFTRSILETGPDGAFSLTPDGRCLGVNRALAEIYGYNSPAEFLASLADGRHQHYFEPGRQGEFLRLIHASGEVARFESQICRRDGTTTWISENARLMRDDTGQPVRCEGTVQDITWRKLAEEVLQQAEEKWRALVESSGECIVIADQTGVVFFANSSAQKSAIGLPGRNIFSEFNSRSQESLRTAIDRAFRSMQAEVLDLERKAHGEPPSWYEVRVVPIQHGATASRVILIASDITAKRRAEEAVRESQRFIGRVADASPAILYVYDVASERYVYVNHQVEKILGYTAEAFLSGGKPLADKLVHRDDAGLVLERMRRLADAADDGVVFECLFRMHNAAGQWLWVRTRDVVFTRATDGRPAQIIGMAEDVTERQRSRQELEHSREQLRALSARLQEAREEERAAISRRVHDELGQALTALNWEISKLKDRPAPTSETSQREAADKLNEMSGMVDAMMQTVRKVSSELRPPILDHFGLVAALEWQAKEFQTRYRIICEFIVRGRVTAPNHDISTAVFRIFQEILTNVARHAAATKVRAQLSENASELTLIVSDNGRGITEGQKSQSLGILGMRERAHLFGGVVEIVGASGKGTTITVRIPQVSGPASGEPRKETLRPLPQPPRST